MTNKISRKPTFNNMLLSEAHDPRDFVIEATLEFITPVFGGGVRLNPDAPHHKDYDRVTPVRGASLRGQLRAWWRWTCGAGLDPQQLRERERLLWGWASTQEKPGKGLVSLRVDASKLTARPTLVYESSNPGKPIDGFGSPIAYGAFPLQPAQNAKDRSSGTLHTFTGQFRVRIEFKAPYGRYTAAAKEAWSSENPGPMMFDEVKRAWMGFVTFGGLGGRTRRGFGAVKVVQPPGVPLKDALQSLGWKERLVTLKSQGRWTPGEAHKASLNKLQQFRQGVNVGRNPGKVPNRPGRSRWPEPDELRRLTGQTAREHRVPECEVHKFPRAAFGLPIIFHFKDKNSGDPADQSLQPQGKERLASPILLRPVVDPDGTVHGVAVRLPVEEATRTVLRTLELRGRRGTCDGLLTDAERASLKHQHLSKATGTSGLDAVYVPFFKYFQS